MKPSGGNEAFLQFIREELMPYVDANYKTQSYKILAGHSFGGITSINCVLTHPGMFDAYIAISPSLWWDREYILKLADRTWQKGGELSKVIFYSDAGEGVSDSSTFHTNLLRFDSIVSGKRIKGLRYAYKYYPAETHMTEPVIAYYDALRFIYKDWKGN
jgi:predicted alpha/beta superfamily hydrolase